MAQSCPHCGKSNSGQARFCNGCGESLFQVLSEACPSCGIVNPESARFCKSCGFILKGKSEPTMSSSIIETIDTGTAEGEDDKRVVKSVGGRKIAEIPDTGELMEELDRNGDLQGLRFLSGTFSESLRQMKGNTKELVRINDRIDAAIRMHQEVSDRKVGESKEDYDLSRKRIRVLEDLSALKKLMESGSNLFRFLGGKEPSEEMPGPSFQAATMEDPDSQFSDFQEEFEEKLEDLDELTDDFTDDLEELEDLEELDGGKDTLEELSDDSGDGLEELSEESEASECPVCNQPVPDDAAKCPNCGVEFE